MKWRTDSRFDKSAFVYDAEADQFRCPAGKTLSRGGQETRQTAGGSVLHVIYFGEMPFAVMKVCFDMRRFLLRGLSGVQAEWQWCCTAFNLKKLMNLIAASRAELRETAKNEL